MRTSPPAFAERLVRWSLASEERPAVLGDLLEEFEERTEWSGEQVARRWYWRQTLTSIVPNLLRRLERRWPRRRPVIGRSAAFLVFWLGFSLPLPRPFGLLLSLVAFMWLVHAPAWKPSKARATFFFTAFFVMAALFVIRGADPASEHQRFITIYLLTPVFLIAFAAALWPWWPVDELATPEA